MIDKELRVPKEIVLTPIALRFFQRIHPTTLTLLAFGFGFVAAVTVWHQAYALGLGLWIVNRTLDGLDGTVARVHGKQSELGGYLDMLLDTFIYALIPLAIVLSQPSNQGWLSYVFLLVSFYLNATSWMYLAALMEKRSTGARAKGELTTITMPGGLVEGAETVLFFTLFLLFPEAYVFLFVLMGALVYGTVVQRFVWATRHL
jgi:phosphatidylglycerophosphate synthase